MNTHLPPILESKLAEFRRRVWVVKLTEGLLAALFGLALSFLLVFALDRLMETPSWLRLALLICGAAVLGLGLPLKWHRWVWRQRRLEDAARLLRHKFPRLGDQLLGIVELAHRDEGTGRSERLVQAAMAQAAEAVKDKDFTQAVPEARHRAWAWAATAAALLVGGAFAATTDAAKNALLRWLSPWSAIERYTFARIEPLPSRLVVPFAEPFTLPVKLSEDTLRKPAAGRAQIGAQPRVEAPRQGDVYPLAFPPQKEDASLAITLGDVRQRLQLLPRPRPELTELALRLKLPDYLGYKTEPRLEVRGATVSIVKGAQAAVEAKASRPLAEAELDGTPQSIADATILSAYTPILADTERRLTWRDQDGLSPRDPLVLKVRALDDEAPRILARRESLEQVVLDSEVVTFDLSATDDFGVRRVGLEWKGAPTDENANATVRGERIAAAGEPEKKEMATRATFCATRDGVAPQTIEVRAWADDYLPGRQRSHSASFVLHILDKTDHALWLTEQFGKWLEAARESYEREQQLHQTNKELRELSAAELDRPENRRRVSQQAAAENANAARVDSLTGAGRSLVEQATKNSEFDGARLESWATMLKSLKDIAAQRMPSVSDLLKQSASAVAGQPPTGGAKPADQSGQPSPADQKPPQENAPTLAQGGSLPVSPKPAGEPKPGEEAKPPVPSLQDREVGFSKAPEPPPADPNAPPKPPGSGKFGLPQTTLAAAPKKPGEETPPAENAAQEKLDGAISEQRDLLAEFAKVSDQLSEILGSLEASTFVKRLKAASRQQLALANGITEKTLDAFGIERAAVKEAAPLATKAKSESEVLRTLQSDLEAYFQRKQDTRFRNLLDQMKKTEAVRALERSGERVTVNLSGQGIAGSEFWADTLDRWAEELVGASECKSCSSASSDSLPPEIVLKVMQALRDEMKLRDETREMESSRPALEEKDYTRAAVSLGDRQAEIGRHTASAIEDIKALEQGEEKFGKELQLLTAVTTVMKEAEETLRMPNTGDAAIAAETEAIELLLQAKRSNPNGGGGGGSNPGGGGTAARASSAALADLGPGGDADASVNARPVGQATGRAGREFPSEFKAGLDAYFGLLESQAAGK